VWWGYYLIAVSVTGGWMSVFGPLIMTLLIRFVSGVAMLDRDQIAKRPAYADYIRNTPAFFPRLWPR
jgi:steroid 5-alpha reductase family enzyme